MSKVLTHKEKERMKELGEANNKLRWFYVEQTFQCTLLNLSKGWYEKTGTKKTSKESWLHSIKHKSTGDTFTISDVDYMKIIDTFRDKNKHLI